jgi:hypothetical protein
MRSTDINRRQYQLVVGRMRLAAAGSTSEE